MNKSEMIQAEIKRLDSLMLEVTNNSALLRAIAGEQRKARHALRLRRKAEAKTFSLREMLEDW